MSSSLWPKHRSLSLRDEITEILKVDEGRKGLFRRLIRDSNNNPYLCDCRDKASKEAQNMHICDKCLNVGYKWSEEWVYFHKMSGYHGSRQMHSLEMNKPPGDIYAPADVFYLEHHVQPTILDCIIEVVLDNNGNVIQPFVRKASHNIRAIEEFRLDYGRVEFYQCSCTEETIGYFGQPLGERVPAAGRI